MFRLHSYARHAVRTAVAVGAVTATIAAGTAWAADTLAPDGDISSVSPNLAYGSSAHGCDTRGTAVTGKVTVNYNGQSANNHFWAGEPVTVTFYPDAGAGITAQPVHATDTIPDGWGGTVQSFDIPFTTTVDPTSTGGHVGVSVAGAKSGYAVGLEAGNGRPQYIVTVNCDTSPTAPADTTKPTITLSHVVDGTGGWNVTSPVSVAIHAADDTRVTSVVCTDTYSGLTSTLAVAADLSSTEVTGDGEHTVKCIAYDAAGNEASATDTVRIDTVPPTITFTGTSPATVAGTDLAGRGWFNHVVTLTWSCADDTSGPVATSVTDTVGEGTGQSSTGTCTDNAGLTSPDEQTGLNVDVTGPDLHIAGPADGTVLDVCNVATRPSFAPTDTLSGVASSGDSWMTPTLFGLGDYTYSAHAADYATNQSSETRVYHANRYGSAFSGFLQPINAGGDSRFKLGSTVPVKFQLRCGGTPITNATAKLWVSQQDTSPNAGDDEAISTAASTTGNLFRYDATSQQYIFNLNTKAGYVNPDSKQVTFGTGTWWLSVSLGDGTTRAVSIQLVK